MNTEKAITTENKMNIEKAITRSQTTTTIETTIPTETAMMTEPDLEEEGVKDNVNFSCVNVGRVYSKVGTLMSHLALVYFL